MTTTTPSGPTGTTSPLTDGPSAASDGTPATAGGDIHRVNVFNGLFLRAEHLNLIQDYALALARAGGQASGPGVVEGFDVSIEDNNQLLVEPGLAINAGGRVLRSKRLVTLSLDDLEPTTSTFWWVEVVGDEWGFGDATVTGTLCDEPCSGSTSARLFIAEGVKVQLTPATAPGLEAVSFKRRRPWLASRLFAREQEQAGYWPEDQDDEESFEDLSTSPQEVVANPPAAVRLAVLIPPPPAGEGGDLQLDIWTARRDRGDPPPAQFRQWRLSMRPWHVFVAQVLQFQDALADRLPEIGFSTARTWRDRVLRELGVVSAELGKVTKIKAHQRLEDLRREAAEGFTSEVQRIEAVLSSTLKDLGFDELPPAGFLPYRPPTGEARVLGGRVAGVKAEINRLAPGLDVRVCVCRPVDVAQAVQEAQHRDRIPLDGGQGAKPAVDVLVPVGEDPNVPLFDWVAFVRRDGRRCFVEEVEAPEDMVVVYLIDDSQEDDPHDADARHLGAGRLPPADGTGRPERVQKLGELSYPERSWAVPDDDVYQGIFAKLQDLGGPVTVFALVDTEERRPLGAVRAFLLAEGFGDDALPLARPRAVKAPEPGEAVVFLVGPAGFQEG
jgi:hypothetical protein